MPRSAPGRKQFDPTIIMELRKRRDYDRTTLSASVGFSQSTLEKIESGHYDPTDEQLREVADALDIEWATFQSILAGEATPASIDQSPTREAVEVLSGSFRELLAAGADPEVEPTDQRRIEAVLDLLSEHGGETALKTLDRTFNDILDRTGDAPQDRHEEYNLAVLSQNSGYFESLLDTMHAVFQSPNTSMVDQVHAGGIYSLVNAIFETSDPDRYRTLLCKGVEVYFHVMGPQARPASGPRSRDIRTLFVENLTEAISFDNLPGSLSYDLLARLFVLGTYYQRKAGLLEVAELGEAFKGFFTDVEPFLSWTQNHPFELSYPVSDTVPSPSRALAEVIKQTKRHDLLEVHDFGQVSEIARVVQTIENGRIAYPTVPLFGEDSSKTGEEKLRELVEQALTDRELENSSELRERAQDELSILAEDGLCNYILTFYDLVGWARQVEDPSVGRNHEGERLPNDTYAAVGPGRGAAASSTVNFLLGLTGINPAKHGLKFARFYNHKRQVGPDIDLDFSLSFRERTRNYLREKWGEDRTFDLYTDAQYETTHSWRTFITALPVGNRAVRQQLKRDYNLSDEVLPPYQLEKAKDSKMGMFVDALGLKALGPIEQLLNDRPDLQDPDGRRLLDIEDNDPQVLRTIREATPESGLFQLRQEGALELVDRLHPDSLTDLSHLLTLYRPGPLGQGWTEALVKRRSGTSDERGLAPGVEAVAPYPDWFSETKGLLVYQEQLMDVLMQELSISEAEADRVRRRLQSEHCFGEYEQQLDPDVRCALLQAPVFNRSHALSYARITYAQAYLLSYHREAYEAAREEHAE